MPVNFAQATRTASYEPRIGESFKIGYSNNAERRIKQLQAGVLGRLFIFRLLAADRKDERRIQDACAAYRLDRELFELRPEFLTRDFGFADLPIPEPRPIAMFPEFQSAMDRAWRQRRKAPRPNAS